MKKYVFYVIAVSLITTSIFADIGDNQKTKKSIHFSNKSKSYDIAVMDGDGSKATTRIDAAYESPNTHRYVYPAKDLKIGVLPIQGGKRLKADIGLLAYNAYGAPAHDSMKYYSLEFKKVNEKPTIRLNYNKLFGYSFEADEALDLKTDKKTKKEINAALGS